MNTPRQRDAADDQLRSLKADAVRLWSSNRTLCVSNL